MSVTVEIFHDPIGPCGPLEQSVDIFRHSAMAAWSFDLDFGAHPVVKYYKRLYANAVGVRVGIMRAVRLRVRMMVTLRYMEKARFTSLHECQHQGMKR